MLYCILNILSKSCVVISTHTTSPTSPASAEPSRAKPDAGGVQLVVVPPPVLPPPVLPPPVLPPPVLPPSVLPPSVSKFTVAGQFDKVNSLPPLLTTSIGTGALPNEISCGPDASTVKHTSYNTAPSVRVTPVAFGSAQPTPKEPGFKVPVGAGPLIAPLSPIRPVFCTLLN